MVQLIALETVNLYYYPSSPSALLCCHLKALGGGDRRWKRRPSSPTRWPRLCSRSVAPEEMAQLCRPLPTFESWPCHLPAVWLCDLISPLFSACSSIN